MTTPLAVLIVEDSEDDMALIVRALQRGGYDLDYERVETAAAMSGCGFGARPPRPVKKRIPSR